jgi:hypothetical protein
MKLDVSVLMIRLFYIFPFSVKLLFSDDGVQQWSFTWGMQKHLTPIKTKHRNRLNLGPPLFHALTKIYP